MSLALFGILQLDRGDPYGYGQLLGLLQAWLQDAGGFAFVGLVVYLIYALYTPTDKSESERLRVPVSRWMLITGAIALICYAGVFALLILGKGAIPMPPPPQPGEPIKIEPPTWHTQQQPMLLMIAGFFSLLAIGEPFARDLLKITRRNVSFNLSGVRRFGQTLNTYTSGLFTRSRVIAILAALGIYALAGVALFAIGVPRLTGIWTWLLVVGAAVFLAALFLLLLFEAEGPMWAVAKLSFKEAVRKLVLWVFVIIFLPFLFPSQWFAADKASDELRNTTLVATFFLSLLTLLPAVLLATSCAVAVQGSVERRVCA